jgi:hypothetical protein
VPSLLDILAAQLERPRELTSQVVSHLVGTYGLSREAIGEFMAAGLNPLEDYEMDLIFSPLFTPTLDDQAVFAELLGRDAVPQSHWPELVQQLVARPTRAQLITSHGHTHPVALREVTIERFVHRLRLDASISESLFKLINHLMPAADRPLLKAIARRAIWQNPARLQILIRYSTATAGGEDYLCADAVQLLRLVETYQPANLAELRALIPHWQQVLRQEIAEASGAKPFYNERVQDLHGGGRDQRRQDNARIKAKEEEIAFLKRLLTVLAG